MSVASLAGLAVPPLTAALAPIGLDDLVGRTALLSRVDRKYLVAPQRLPEFIALLAADPDSTTRVLELEGRREFGYRSVYFDTEHLQLHRAAGQGRRRRCKVRTRHYLDSDQVWLEVKSRGFRRTSVKQRIELPDGDPATLGPIGRAFVADVMAEHEISGVDPDALVPVLTSSYRRTTLHHRDRARGLESRITIDTELGFATGRGDPEEWVWRHGTSIVEVKAGPATVPAEWLLWRLGSRPVSISKYGAGLVIARPGTREMKWHRAVDRLNRAQSTTVSGGRAGR